MSADADENSVIIDPDGPASNYIWQSTAWARPDRRDLVIYEMHVADFTWQEREAPSSSAGLVDGDAVSDGNQGSFDGVTERIEYLEALGVNAVQLMPVQEWPGQFYSWGYNPSLYWAIEAGLSSNRSDPEQVLLDFKEMVDALHQSGIAVILDVVYNHVDGSSPLSRINTAGYIDGDTPWGPRLDISDDFIYSYVLDNLKYLMDEFRIDGFRFDATEHSDGASMRSLINELYSLGYGDRYYIFEEFNGDHNEAIQAYNALHGETRISSWGTGYKDAIYPALADAGYSGLGSVTYHSNDNGWIQAASAISYASSHDEGTLYFHAGNDDISSDGIGDDLADQKQLALTSLTHVLTSLGIPMIWMGDELMRDHRGNSSDTVSGSGSNVDEINNQVDWQGLASANSEYFLYLSNLIHLRAIHPSIGRAVSQPDSDGSSLSDGFMWLNSWGDEGDISTGLIAYIRAVAGDRPFAVFINYGDSDKSGFVVNLQPPYQSLNESWTLVADSSIPLASQAGLSVGGDLLFAGGQATLTIPSNTAYIFMGPVNF